MRRYSTWIEAGTAGQLHMSWWLPDGTPKAVLIVVHGMAEHSARYERFAEVLCSQGIGVYAHDQRGHGLTGYRETLGHYADSDGWDLVLADLQKVYEHVSAAHIQVPIFLFGHSMGSYIAQGFLIRYAPKLSGAIICGSNFQPIRLYRLARFVVGLERLRQGKRGRSRLFNWLTFGAFNRAFQPQRTEFDWLSRDPAEVDKYIADSLCGFLCTNQLWHDLLSGLIEISSLENLGRIEAQLPIYVVGGAEDPVSAGNRLRQLAQALISTGHGLTLLNLYPGARHELLNETNRDEVARDLLQWIEHCLRGIAVGVVEREIIT
jgi:alpha-beta hydrolase superfamily lysophospholipase